MKAREEKAEWHIAYTRFRQTEGGNFVCSKPIVTDVPWWLCPCEGRMHKEGEDVTKDIESWRYMKSFAAREDGEAELARFPIEEYTLVGDHGRSVRVYSDGRSAWEIDRMPSKDALRLDPMYRQCEWENEFGYGDRTPPAVRRDICALPN